MGSRLAKPALDAGLVTADAGPLLRFYTGVFGLAPSEPLEIPGVGTIHRLGCGESVLRVMVPEQPPEPDDARGWSTRSGIRYLTLEVADVAAAVAEVQKRGGRVELEPFELRPGRLVAQVFDPDGNMVEIGQDQPPP